MTQIRTLLLSLSVCAALAAPLRAQFTFAYLSAANPVAVSVGSGGSVTFPGTPVGSSSTLTLIGQNQGYDTWSITGYPVTGGDFKIASPPPGSVAGQASFQLTLTFTPSSAAPLSGGLSLKLSGPQAATATYNFFLAGTGQSPGLAASYILNPDGNQIPLAAGGVIAFPPTPTQSTSTATFIVLNRGNGPGKISNITLTGDQFKLTGLPLLPAVVQPGADFRFTVAYTPTSQNAASGAVRVDMDGGPLSAVLSGQGVGATYAYDFTTASGSTAVSPGGTIVLADTPVGSVTSSVLRIRNTGNGDGRVANIAVVGAAFKLLSVPPLPAAIPANGALTFTLQLAPTDSGPATGQLLVDNVTFALSANAVGARLTFASRIGATVTPVPDAGTITFPNTTIGSTNSVFIGIGNTGNSPGRVNGISVSTAVFTAPSLPALPVTIAPGQTVEFRVDFLPTATGTVTATLQIDDHAITLRGIANGPPALPAVAFTSLTGSATALQQPSVGLSLAAPYSLDLTGALTLSFVPDSFADDPSIQFATGGRSVPFTIPANTTDALFGGSSKTVQFQSGSVSGVITVSASFAAGAAGITPNPAPSKTVAVAAAAPQIRNVQVGARTATSFELLVTGLSTPRSVTQLSLSFTPSPGANLSTTSLSMNVEAPFTTWYQSATGQSFGSQFTASVVINVTGDINAVQSASVAASNQQGASSAVSVNLH